jgi:ATP-dependent Clp protease ATP-binding subunit ClpA
MIKLLSEEVENIINDSWENASERRQEYLLLENILFTALGKKEVQDIMIELDVDWKKLRDELDTFLDTEIEKIEDMKHPKQTVMFKKMLQHMIFHSQDSGKISQVEDLLIAMFTEPETTTVYLMQKYGVDDYALKELATDMRHPEDEEPDYGEVDVDEPSRGGRKKRKKKSALEQFSINLTEAAADGKIDPVIGRDEETERFIQILCRKKKNNPLLVGEAGVGKTACAEKLALDIVNDNVPKQIKDWEVFSIDVTAMIAGAKFRGDFEQRLQDILKELEKKEKCIAFIDEFHTMFGLGANSSNQLDATNILKPAMMNGKIRIAGATTYEEAKNTIDKNKPMARRFQKVDVVEPDEETTFKILKGLKKTFEDYHNVSYTDKILKQIVSLSGKHLVDTHFPDKAIDIVDEVGSVIKLLNQSDDRVAIKEADITDLISKKARVPVVIEEGDDKLGLANLTENIQTKLYGQDHAIEEVTDKIMMGRAGLNEPGKPLGAFMLAGPSGVGKTELARQLSEQLGNLKLLRYDMSEFMEETGVAKLTGSAQGYVGYEEGGRLINDIKKHPHCILLLDEFEKSHTKIQNTFLQILEEAELTSSDGTKADFRNVFILFTTNAGSKVSKTVGFGGTAGKSKSNAQIEKTFSPEFRNRLDGVITFNPLGEDQVFKVAEKILNEVRDQLKTKKVQITVTKAAKLYMADKGFDADMGARPMKRVIQDLVKKPVAKEIVLGDLKDGGRVKVDVTKTNEITLKYTSQEELNAKRVAGKAEKDKLKTEKV